MAEQKGGHGRGLDSVRRFSQIIRKSMDKRPSKEVSSKSYSVSQRKRRVIYITGQDEARYACTYTKDYWIFEVGIALRNTLYSQARVLKSVGKRLCRRAKGLEKSTKSMIPTSNSVEARTVCIGSNDQGYYNITIMPKHLGFVSGYRG
jgi:hypothetical protein